MGGAGRSLVQNALSAGSDEDALSGAFSASLGRQSSAPWALPNPPGPQARGQKPALESTGSTQTALWHRRDLKGSPFCLPPGPLLSASVPIPSVSSSVQSWLLMPPPLPVEPPKTGHFSAMAASPRSSRWFLAVVGTALR